MKHKQELPDFNNKKSRDNWLASLPLGHKVQLESILNKTLQDLNKAVIPPHQRFISLETIAQPLSQLLHVVKLQAQNTSFPTTEKYQHQLEAFCRLLHLASDGYSKTVESFISHGHDKPGSFVTTAIYRTMQLQLTIQFIAYTHYKASAPSSWSNLHKLYQLTLSKHSSLENVIPSPLDVVNAKHIDSLYKQALLLHLANPAQLSNVFIFKLATTLNYWSQYCDLYEVTDPSAPQGIFVVQMSGPNPPRPTKNSNITIGQTLCFDTTRLLSRIKQIVAQPGVQLLPGNVKDLINNNPFSYIKRIYRSWGNTTKRAFPRRQTQQSLYLTMGFNSIHTRLFEKYGGHKLDAETTQIKNDSANFSGTGIANIDGSGLYPEFFELTDPNDHIRQNSIGHMQLRGVEDRYIEQHTHEAVKTQFCANIINESAGGYCLSIPNRVKHAISIGDLVCFDSDTRHDSASTLCVIRWMKETNNHFLFGIEVIACFVEAVIIMTLNKRRDETIVIPGLLLPQIASLNLDSSLITRKSAKLNKRNEYLLKTSTGEAVISLTEHKDATGLYDQFSYNAGLTMLTEPYQDTNMLM